LAASPELNLLHRYEARLHRMYQRALNNLAMLGEPELPKEPSPIPGQCAPVVQVPGGDAREVEIPTTRIETAPLAAGHSRRSPDPGDASCKKSPPAAPLQVRATAAAIPNRVAYNLMHENSTHPDAAGWGARPVWRSRFPAAAPVVTPNNPTAGTGCAR
jgi:hypothetical protein